MGTIYDLIILGAGPAGLAAGLYGGRYRLNTLLIERSQDGGQIAITSDIENYPGQMVEAEESEIEKVKTILAEEMQGAADLLVPLEIDMKQGSNWYEAH